MCGPPCMKDRRSHTYTCSLHTHTHIHTPHAGPLQRFLSSQKVVCSAGESSPYCRRGNRGEGGGVWLWRGDQIGMSRWGGKMRGWGGRVRAGMWGWDGEGSMWGWEGERVTVGVRIGIWGWEVWGWEVREDVNGANTSLVPAWNS